VVPQPPLVLQVEQRGICMHGHVCVRVP
jgi:hypothetical protein